MILILIHILVLFIDFTDMKMVELTMSENQAGQTMKMNFMMNNKEVKLNLQKNEHIPANTPVLCMRNGKLSTWRNKSTQVSAYCFF